jgi:hypothetical protein
MNTQERGIVLRFRNVEKAPVRAHSRLRPSAGPAAAPAVVLASQAGDGQINADWDLLIRVASHAWSWRDPESLDSLEQTVRRLRTWIDRDWRR